jgi:hypothetical protein
MATCEHEKKVDGYIKAVNKKMSYDVKDVTASE